MEREKSRNNQKDSFISRLFGFGSRHYYVVYSLCFVILLFLVFGIFFVNGKSFIWDESIGDGWVQHFNSLIYYAKWLRSIIKSLLFEHTLDISTFSFSIGYGSDVLTTLNYCVIGDPLNLLSVFVPTRYMAYFYSGLILVRFYLSGLAFSAYCFYREKVDKTLSGSNGYGKTSILAGSLVYVFCGFALVGGIRHPYFMNPMIYFPLVLMGVEKILDKKSPVQFILAVCLSAASNFYFFYMIAILTVFYTIWRLIARREKGQFKKSFISLFKIAGSAILGTCMSALLFLPVVLSFFTSGRLQTDYQTDLFYTFEDYERNIRGFLSSSTYSNWTTLGFGAIALIAVILLFIQKKHRDLKVAFLFLTLILLIPMFGSFMNGFSYATNRWVWGYSFLVCFILVIKWNSLFALTKNEKIILFAVLSVYFILCILLVKSRTVDALFAMVIAFMAWGILAMSKDLLNLKTSQILIIVFLVAGIAGNALFLYSPRNSAYIDYFVNYDGIMNRLNATEAVALESVSDMDEDGFSRYAGEDTTVNATLHSGLHSTQYYWSLENGAISKYRNDMAIPNDANQEEFSGIDSRTFLSALDNVKYYVQDDMIPYGYKLVDSVDNYESIEDYLEKNLGEDFDYNVEALNEEEKTSLEQEITTYEVWENELFLPFGYTYSHYISKEDYEDLTPLEKQEAMLQGCVLEGEENQGEEAKLSFTGKNIDYDLSCDDAITIEDNVITVNKKNASITLTFKGEKYSETYLYFAGLSFSGIEPRDRYTDLQWSLLSDSEKNEVRFSQRFYNEPTALNLNISAINKKKESSSNVLKLRTPRYTWYSNRENFLVNLGYDNRRKTSITIKFPEIGTYSFDSLEVLCQPMENYQEQISALAEDVMENVDFHISGAAFTTNIITGTIDLDSSKYLLLTIPYTQGWTAYVDGEKQELLQANTMYMALYLDEGEHDICLTYSTPGLLWGGVISIASFLILLAIMLVRRNSLREKSERNTSERRLK